MLTRFQQNELRFSTPAARFAVGYIQGAFDECKRENPARPFRDIDSRGNRLLALALGPVVALVGVPQLPAPDPSRAARVANARLRLRMAIDRQQRAETIEEFLADADAMERAQRELRELGAQHEADAVFALFDPQVDDDRDGRGHVAYLQCMVGPNVLVTVLGEAPSSRCGSRYRVRDERGEVYEVDADRLVRGPSFDPVEARADELEALDRDDSDAGVDRRSGISADDTVDSRGRPLRPSVNDAGEPWWM